MGIYFNCFISLRPGLWTETVIPLQDLGGRKRERGGEKDSILYSSKDHVSVVYGWEGKGQIMLSKVTGQQENGLIIPQPFNPNEYKCQMSKSHKLMTYNNYSAREAVMKGQGTDIQSTGDFDLSCSLSPGNGAMHHQCEIRVHWSRQHVFQLQIEFNSHQYALVIFFLSIWIGSFIFVNMACSWLLFLAFESNTIFAVCSGYKRNINAMM